MKYLNKERYNFMLRKLTKTILTGAVALTTILVPSALANDNTIKLDLSTIDTEHSLRVSIDNMSKDLVLMEFEGDSLESTIKARDYSEEETKWLTEHKLENETDALRGVVFKNKFPIAVFQYSKEAPYKARTIIPFDKTNSAIKVKVTKITDDKEILKQGGSFTQALVEDLLAQAEYETQEITIKPGETKEISNFVKKGEKPAEQSTTVNTEETSKQGEQTTKSSNNLLYAGLGFGILVLGVFAFLKTKKK